MSEALGWVVAGLFIYPLTIDTLVTGMANAEICAFSMSADKNKRDEQSNLCFVLTEKILPFPLKIYLVSRSCKCNHVGLDINYLYMAFNGFSVTVGCSGNIYGQIRCENN